MSIRSDQPLSSGAVSSLYPPKRAISGVVKGIGTYTDQELDAATGLYNYDARLYDPVVGRFVSADSIVPDWYNPQALNRYAYVLNNPLAYTDPSGHDPRERTQKWIDDGAPDRQNLYAMESFVKHIDLVDYWEADVDNFSDSEMDAHYEIARKHYDQVALGLGIAVGARQGFQTEIKAPKKPLITKPYKRPSGATTKDQRESVQGKPCVDCGAGGKKYADHKKPLVKEYYETGTIDQKTMRDLDSVQPQCPTCSNKQGGELRKYSIEQRRKHGL